MSWLDNLYLEGRFLKQITNFKKFEEFLIQKQIKFEDCKKGYFYIIELSINYYIWCIEMLIQDEKMENLVHWGDITSDQILRDVKKNCKDIQFINGLENFRDKITDIRIKQDKNPSVLFESIIKKINEIEEYYLTNLKFIKKTENFKNENHYYNFHIRLTKMYVETDFDLNLDSVKLNAIKKDIPEKIGESFYYLAPPKLRAQYHLQNPELVKHNSEYLLGYKLALAFSYKNLIDDELVSNLINVTDWNEIHKIGSRINKILNENKQINLFEDKLYDVEYDLKPSEKSFNKITNMIQLIYVLENRGIKLQNEPFEYNPFSSHHSPEPVLFNLLFGAIHKNLMSNDQTQIIEFMSEINGDKRYSYAIYLFYGGTISNGSYWLLFKDIGIENDWDKIDPTKIQIEQIIKSKENAFNFQKYEIDEAVLNTYLKKNDADHIKIEGIKSRLKKSNSLLTELIGLYLKIKNLNEKITHLNWGHEFFNDKNEIMSEIDGIIVSESKIILIQSKIKLHDSVEEIKSHFKKIETHLPEYCKKHNLQKGNKIVEKELFIFSDEFIDEEIDKIKKSGINVTCFEKMIENQKYFQEKHIDRIMDAIGYFDYERDDDNP